MTVAVSGPVYFAVVKELGRESPRRFFAEVPRCYSHKERKGELVYSVRIDTMPNGDALIAAPLDDLMRLYRAKVASGRLNSGWGPLRERYAG